jgi:hypothetical protein
MVAGLLNGLAAAGIVAPLWTPPLVAAITCTEVELGVAAYRSVSGLPPRALRWRRRSEAAIAVGVVLTAAALAGPVGAALTNVSAPGVFSIGLAGWVGAGGMLLASAAVVVSLCLSLTVCELARRRQLTIVLLEGSLLATAALLAVAYFAPVLQPAQLLSPWVGIWPLHAADAHSPLLAVTIDPTLARIATTLWVGLLIVITARRQPTELPRQRE